MSSRSRDVRDLFFKQRIHEDIMALPRDEPDREWKAELLRANIPRHLWEATLDDFGGNEEAARLTQRYCTKIEEAFEKGFGFLLSGPDGSGKTTLIALTLKEAIRHGYSAFFITFPQLIGLIHGCFELPELWAEVERITRDTQFLAIAEAGRDCDGEGLGDFALSELEAILRHRGGWLLPTLLATELEKCELQHVYEDSLMSVIGGRLHIVDVGSLPKRRQTMEKRTKKKALTGKKAKKKSKLRQFHPCLRDLLARPEEQPANIRERLRTLKDLAEVGHLIVADVRRVGASEAQATSVLKRFFTQRVNGLGEAYLEDLQNFVGKRYAWERCPILCSTVQKQAPWLCKATCDGLLDAECPFPAREKNQAEARRKQQAEDDRFDELGWPQFLAEQYDGLGPVAETVYEAFLEWMATHSLDYSDLLIVGYRALATVCKALGCTTATKNSVNDAVDLLIAHGLVKKVQQGRVGKDSGKSNAYQILLPTPATPVFKDTK